MRPSAQRCSAVRLSIIFRERSTEEPDFRALESDGDHQIRDYPALTVAETVVNGPRREALDQGLRILADYLFAKSRDGDEACR